jgi:hypothetical protein
MKQKLDDENSPFAACRSEWLPFAACRSEWL